MLWILEYFPVNTIILCKCGLELLIYTKCQPLIINPFFALRAGIGDNAAYPSGSAILFLSRKVITTASNLVNGYMA